MIGIIVYLQKEEHITRQLYNSSYALRALARLSHLLCLMAMQIYE